jgi:hypothetical protein
MCVVPHIYQRKSLEPIGGFAGRRCVRYAAQTVSCSARLLCMRAGDWSPIVVTVCVMTVPRCRQVRDFRNDVILAEACRTDVELHCPNVPAGARRRARSRASPPCL